MMSLAEAASRIRKLRERSCRDVIEIGRLLVEARAALEHGNWGSWLREEFCWSQDTAERFIRVFQVFGEANSALMRNLDPTALYELSRSSTPQEARDVVLELIEADTPPSLRDVKRIIREAKPPVEPQPEKPPARQAALREQFDGAITALLSLSTRSASTFVGAASADDLDMLANFLRQIAASEKRAA